VPLYRKGAIPPIKLVHPHDYFNTFLQACSDANELQKLYSAFKAGWTEDQLADLARVHFSKPFAAMGPGDLIAVINSAAYRDYFARRFLKQRKRAALKASKAAQRSLPPSNSNNQCPNPH
jgi:hypothetical protein